MLETPLPTLETPRLRLRWMTRDDVPALFRIFGDPEVTRYWAWPALKDRAAAEKLLEDMHQSSADKKMFQWGITTKEDDTVIGTCTLVRPDAAHKRTEIGYALASAMQGRGYAREAVSALINFAIDQLGMHRFEADIDPRNDASIALAEALGFRREGFLPERYQVAGEIQDTVLYGLLAPAWKNRQKQPETKDGLVRLMRASDRERVLSLLAVQLEEHGVPIDREVLARAIDGVAQRPDAGQFFVADKGEGPIGFAYIGFTWTLELGGLVSWLEELYVVPEERNSGIGTKLLELALETAKARGARGMDLEVESDHRRAANLYLRHGFRQLTRTRYQRRLV